MWLRRMASRRSTSMAAVASWPGHDLALDDAGLMAVQARQRVGGVEHLGPAGLGRRWCRCRRPGRRSRRRTGCGRARSTPGRRRRGRSRPAPGPRPRTARARRTRWGRTRRAPPGTAAGRRPTPSRRRASLARCRCSAMASAKPASSTSTPALEGDLAGQLEREAVGVVQGEGHRARQHVRRASRRVELGVEDGRARLQRLAEPLLLVGHDVADELVVLDQRRVGLAHDLDGGVDQAGGDQVLDVEQVGVAHGPPDDAAHARSRGPRWTGTRRR